MHTMLIENIANLKVLDKKTGEIVLQENPVRTTIEPELSKNENFECSLETTFLMPESERERLLYMPRMPVDIQMEIPVLVCTKWHKKRRIRKKWIKRYGIKEETIFAVGAVDYGCFTMETNDLTVEMNADIKRFKMLPTQLQQRKGYIQLIGEINYD